MTGASPEELAALAGWRRLALCPLLRAGTGRSAPRLLAVPEVEPLPRGLGGESCFVCDRREVNRAQGRLHQRFRDAAVPAIAVKPRPFQTY